MGMAAALLPEFDREMANTRRMLERVREDRLAWKPHERSMTMGDLATHLAQLPRWASIALGGTEFDMAPAGEEPPRAAPVASTAQALQRFDGYVAEARAAIEGASDEHLLASWSLLSGGKAVFTIPRAAVLRGMVMNHIIHHRAQLGVYLRLCDVPVPGMYGASADEASGPRGARLRGNEETTT